IRSVYTVPRLKKPRLHSRSETLNTSSAHHFESPTGVLTSEKTVSGTALIGIMCRMSGIRETYHENIRIGTMAVSVIQTIKICPRRSNPGHQTPCVGPRGRSAGTVRRGIKSNAVMFNRFGSRGVSLGPIDRKFRGIDVSETVSETHNVSEGLRHHEMNF